MEALDSAAPGPTFPFRVALVLGPPHPATPAKVGKSAGAERRVVLESPPFDMKPKTSDGKGARKSADALPFEVDLRKPGRLVDQFSDGLRQAIRSVYRRGETF